MVIDATLEPVIGTDATPRPIEVIDATPPRAREFGVGYGEALDRFNDKFLGALVELRDLGDHFPVASPVHDLAPYQARRLLHFAQRLCTELFNAVAAERQRQS